MRAPMSVVRYHRPLIQCDCRLMSNEYSKIKLASIMVIVQQSLSNPGIQPSGLHTSTITLNRRSGRGIYKMFIPVALCLYIISSRPFSSIMKPGRLTNDDSSYQRIGSSFIDVASASPVPEPSPARSRHSAHRLPPINGSIFGKRSLESSINKSDNKASERISNLEEQFSKDYNTYGQQEDKTHSQTYQDIITELIEDFMALNKESNPEEASVSFCRMIVYQCEQLLSMKSRSSVNGDNDKYRSYVCPGQLIKIKKLQPSYRTSGLILRQIN